MNILILILITLSLYITTGSDAEFDIFEQELNAFKASSVKAIDYTLYFSSHHFDINDKDNWESYKASPSQNNIESKILQQELSQLSNHRSLLDEDVLNEISACSSAFKELNDRKLCIHFDHEQGLKLAVSDNAKQAPNDMIMYEFDNDDHWNRIDIVDNLNMAAARGMFA